MLQLYIDEYKEALRRGDRKTIARIERELQSIGMDSATLKYLVAKSRKDSTL